MAVLLADFQKGMANKVDHEVIRVIRENSRLMDLLVFDDAVTPEGGSTLVYGYTQLKTPATASGRALNSDYTPQEAVREVKTTQLAIMGGSYQIDRVIAKNSARFLDEVAFQNEQKAKATTTRFQYLAINGDKQNAGEFDGLDALITGTANDFTTSVDISGSMTEAKAIAVCEALDEAIANVQDGCNAILCNTKTKVKLQSASKLLGYLQPTEDAFGRVVNTYNGIEIIDMGKYYNGSASVDVIGMDAQTKLASVYCVNLSKSGLHAVTPQGGVGLSTCLPDYSTAGAVKTGDVEMVSAVVLKNTNNASRIKVKLA